MRREQPLTNPLKVIHYRLHWIKRLILINKEYLLEVEMKEEMIGEVNRVVHGIHL